jgi:hypothetical protein
VPSLLHSRGLLAGAGSAASLIAAAVASLLFATGLVAFTSWPAAGGGSVSSVSLPAAPSPGGVPTGAAGRTSAAVSAAPAIVLPAAASAPGRRGVARTIARTGGRGGSTPSAVTASPPASSPTTSGSQGSPGAQGSPAVTRQVTDRVADTTSAATDTVGSTVGGPPGTAIQTTGDQAAQTIRDLGTATQPLLGALGG